MNSPAQRVKSIKGSLHSGEFSIACRLWGASGVVAINDLLQGSSLASQPVELSGRSILLATNDQLAAALALIELDGVASRIVICPPETPVEHFPALIRKGEIDAIVSDYELPGPVSLTGVPQIRCGCTISPRDSTRVDDRCSEWVLLSSGTTGAPKMIVHSLSSLAAPIRCSPGVGGDIVWGTFYDIRRYGGLQIFLRAVMGAGSLVLAGPGETTGQHLRRLATHGVTHVSGTPSHWRRAQMSPESQLIAPSYIRLSGEIVDQTILNSLRSFYPKAAIGHAFASTEAGVGFEVNDGLAGFPAAILESPGEVQLKIHHGSLQIRSDRTASRYLDSESGNLADAQGFVDTGDMVELRRGRYHFLGRRNGVINVGGLKVYPEEVETVINRHPAVQMSLVRPKRNPITGSLVSADVMLKEDTHPAGRADSIRCEIMELCRLSLAQHKVPVIIRYVPSLEVAAPGKLARNYA